MNYIEYKNSKLVLHRHCLDYSVGFVTILVVLLSVNSPVASPPGDKGILAVTLKAAYIPDLKESV